MNNSIGKYVDSKVFMVVECLMLFVILPLVIKWQLQALLHYFFPILLGMTLYGLFHLRRDPEYQLRSMFRLGEWKLGWERRLGRFIFTGIVMLVLIYFLRNDLLFSLVRNNVYMWIVVMIIYPVLSVTTQEVIFRAFYFQRYKKLFGDRSMMLFSSVLAFGFAHWFFGNWIAISLSTIGGYVFGKTYQETKSLFMCWLEHSAYGCLIFTVGLFDYFNHMSDKIPK